MTDRANTEMSTAEQLVHEFVKLTEPLEDAAQLGPQGVEKLIDESGLGPAFEEQELEQVVALASEEVLPAIETVSTALEDSEISSAEEAFDVIEGFVDLFDSIRALSRVEVGDEAVTAVGEQLLDYLVVRYLSVHHQDVHSVLGLAGIIEEPPEGPVELDLSMVGDLLTDPNQLIVEAMGWGAADGRFDPFVLLFFLHELLGPQGVPSTFTNPDPDTLVDATAGTLADELAALESRSSGQFLPLDALFEVADFGDLVSTTNMPSQALEVDLVSGSNGTLGIRFVPLPAHTTDSGEKFPGVALFPFGAGNFGAQEPLGDDWTLKLSVHAEQSDWGLSIQPGTDSAGPEMVSPEGDAIGGEVHGTAELVYTPSGADGPGKVLLGEADGTGVTLDSVAVRATVDYSGDDVSLAVELPSSGRFALQPEGGFLTTVLPAELGFDFDVTVGWSNLDGFFLEGGGTLSASVPLHLEFGFGSINELYLAVDRTNPESELTLEAATSPTISLGPLTGSVRRLGISAEVSFPPDRDGNMGPLDLSFGFRPPDGIGLSIDAGGVTGGGFLTFEPDQHRYSGGLELQFGGWGLKVIGLLQTRVPGSDGYSLLLLVTADLPPIQLGFGFVLTGIGGLAGINRGFETKPLGDAVRSGNLDSVLFPSDVVANADQIVTDLRAIFPPKADRHVFGPMMRLGWGTPQIITAELGVLVSIPTWKIALLGKFMVDLPTREAPLIDLNLAVVGLLDIPNQELSIDASLYESRIVTWTVSGDMAMRLAWGDDARFMLSVGGFHPRYEPPTGFPKLDRVRAALAVPGGNPRLELTGYFAVTPNTFQVGAGAALHGKFGPAVVDGKLSFDALFRFNPFSFEVDIYAGISVRIYGSGLSLRLSGSLSGPQPYRVRGKLSIEILFIDITVSVDARFGSSGETTELPTADVLPELLEAVTQHGNWNAQKPKGGPQLVTLRDPNSDADADGPPDAAEPGADVLLAHPLGSLSVRQQVVPLGITIEKYGNAMPKHATYDLEPLAVTGSDATNHEYLRERFAAARFTELTDSEKLEAEPFEQLPAGRTVGSDGAHYAGAEDPLLLSWATLAYESSVIDEQNDQYRLDTASVTGQFAALADNWSGTLPLTVGHELAAQSAVGTAETRTTGTEAYENPTGGQRIGVSDQRYVVVWADDLSRVADGGNPREGQTRIEAQQTRTRLVAERDIDPDAVQVVGVQELDGVTA